MKVLIFFLAVLGVQSDAICGVTEYKGTLTCLSAARSPCETCNGSDQCESCPADFVTNGACDQCTDNTKMPVNKKCVSCSSLGGEGHDGKSCKPKAGSSSSASDFCPKSEGVYKQDGFCYACYLKSFVCKECSYTNDEYKCDVCPDDAIKIELPMKELSFCLANENIEGYNSFGSGLVSALALLIAFLTLI